MPFLPKTELSDAAYQRLITQKSLDGFENVSWSIYLTWKFQDTELSPGVGAQIRRGTKSELAPMWMMNLAGNLPQIREDRLTLRDLAAPEPVDKPCLILGRGPSVFGFGVLDEIYYSDAYQEGKLTIIACDGIYKDCLKKGITPDYVTTVDGHPICAKWYRDIDPDRVFGRTRFVISTQASPDVVKAINAIHGEIYWFQPATDLMAPDNPKSLTLNLSLLTATEDWPGVVSMDCLGNVGGMSFIFAWNVLKSRNICWLGLDMGYPKGMPLDETYYWDTVLQRMGAVNSQNYYTEFYNPATKETYVMDPVFKCYQEAFLEVAMRKPDWLKIYNASSGTLYLPQHITPTSIGDWLEAII